MKSKMQLSVSYEILILFCAISTLATFKYTLSDLYGQTDIELQYLMLQPLYVPRVLSFKNLERSKKKNKHSDPPSLDQQSQFSNLFTETRKNKSLLLLLLFLLSVRSKHKFDP